LAAAKAGTLLSYKHDEANLHDTSQPERSVIAPHVSKNLFNFFDSDDYKMVEYENPKYPSTPRYIEIIPNPTSTFSVPASGVPAASSVPNQALDRLVIISGYKQGIHVHGEDSAEIQRKLSGGALVFKGNL
jgi:hypothetical protein